MTPKRTIAVALSAFVAAAATPFAAGVVTGQLAGCPCPNFGSTNYSHPLWHLVWGVLLVAIALGMNRLRRGWPTTGSMGRRLTAALLLALAAAAGQLLAGLWAAGFMKDPDRVMVTDTRPYLILHTVGEAVAFGSFLGLLMVCLALLASDSEDSLEP